MRKIFLAAFAAATLSAQKAPSWEELRIDQIKILEKLDQILKAQERTSKILEEADAPPAPAASVKIDVSKSPFLGDPAAPITIVEFTDFQCPYCNKFYTDTWPKLHDEFVVTGKVMFVRRDFPLSMHQHANQAAQAGRCAGEQGHYWEMTDWMQLNPTSLDLEHLREHALEIDLDLEQFRSCMVLAKYADAVDADAKLAEELHITGTPAFIIGKSGQSVEGPVIMGNLPLATFKKAIEAVKDSYAK